MLDMTNQLTPATPATPATPDTALPPVSTLTSETAAGPAVGPALTAMLSGMAGGLAWGIRGQYGHETGAMIAGVLIGFVLLLLHGRHLSSTMAARAVAMFALGISIGGCMTYGQTVGLTHDGPLVGNAGAYRWGMLGLAIKGGIWFALGAACFGMGLSGKSYRPLELLLVFALMTAALFLGTWLLNAPFDPENRLLPKLYFSDHWYWEPDVDKPRRERWGGLLAAFVVLLVWLGGMKRDWLAFSLGMWGLLGGALGFPGGQAIQAFNAWNSEWIQSLPTSPVTSYFNWWNMMETAFGCIAGATVGLGVWVHRNWVGFWSRDAEESVVLSPFTELLLLAIHVPLLVAWNFQSIDYVDMFADLAIPMVVIPCIAVMAGRYWPYLMALPVVMLPIAGKTFRQLVLREELVSVEVGAYLYIAVPLVVATLVAMFFALHARRPQIGKWFIPGGTLVAVWSYFLLNNAFFHSPWPWREWTGRTPNGFLFLAFSILITVTVIFLSATPANTSNGKSTE